MKQSRDLTYPRRTVASIYACLVLIIFGVFSQTLRHEFVNYDDDVYVYENPAISGGLTTEGIIWGFTHVHTSYWHPLTWISHMLDAEFYGLNAGGHHLTSVLLHAVTAILLFKLLLLLSSATERDSRESFWCSAVVAALFAIHPLRVESVAWVSERKDVLSGLFFMLTLMAYVRYARLQAATDTRRSKIFSYLLVLLLFGLGLMSKPMLVTLPCVLLLLDYWPLGRLKLDSSFSFRHSKYILLEKLPMLLMSAVCSVAAVLATVETGAIDEKLPMLWRIGNAAAAYATYLWQTVWPTGLAVLYPHPADRLPLSAAILSLVLITVICAVVFLWRRKYPYAPTGWLWFMGMLVPVIGFMQVGAQAHADRYTYLPQIGLFILLVWGVADLSRPWRHRRIVLGSSMTAILIALAICSWIQTTHWRDSKSLWTHTLKYTSNNWTAHNNLGTILFRQGDVRGAIEQYKKALSIHPNHDGAHNNLGNALHAQGKLAEAVECYKRTLELNANHQEAHNNLGFVLHAQGEYAEAVECYRRALDINPTFAVAHNNLGMTLYTQGKLSEAVVHFREAVKIKPHYSDAHNNLGGILTLEGKLSEAIEHYRSALQIEPDYMEAEKNLNIALASRERLAEKIEHYRRYLSTYPDDANALLNMGTTLQTLGMFAEASEHYEKTLQIEPENTSALNNLAWLLATGKEAGNRNGNKAVELARLASTMAGGKNPAILDTLAAAYAEAGDFPEAIETAQRALSLALVRNDATLVNAVHTRLKLYQSGLPYHD
jgi:tetratricopeptide (TPR) repeat protein